MRRTDCSISFTLSKEPLMTRKKRYLFSYLLLALALVVLFAANLF